MSYCFIWESISLSNYCICDSSKRTLLMYGANDLQEKVDFFRGGLGTSWISGDWPYHLSPQEQTKYLDLKIRKTSNQTLSAEVVVGKNWATGISPSWLLYCKTFQVLNLTDFLFCSLWTHLASGKRGLLLQYWCSVINWSQV